MITNVDNFIQDGSPYSEVVNSFENGGERHSFATEKGLTLSPKRS